MKTLANTPDEMRKTCEKYWDIQSYYCLALNADNGTDDEIAAALGIPIQDVLRCLCPVDESVWDGMMSQFWKGPWAESRYRAEVQQALAQARSTSYQQAARQAAKIVDGGQRLVPELERGQQRCDREAAQWNQKCFEETFRYRKNDQPWVNALKLCAWTAVRIALGIEKARKKLWLGELFLTFNSMCEALINLRKTGWNEQGRHVWVPMTEQEAEDYVNSFERPREERRP